MPDGPAGARGVAQTVQTVLRKSATPFADCDLGKAQGSGNLLVGLSRGRGEDDATPQGHALGGGRGARSVL